MMPLRTPFAVPTTIPTTHAPERQRKVTPPPKTTKHSISELFTAIIRVLAEVFEIREAEIEALCFRLCELIVPTGLPEPGLPCDDDRLTESALGGDEEATRLSIAVALEDGWRYARSLRQAFDVAREGAVALERINFGRRQVDVLDIGLDADLPSDEIECELAIASNVPRPQCE
ncbi:hypothetical protein V494_04008 [Pseudogymnoascus sp. VKM F-4513 (FW-928)]|nr:hypothetical protein V494_04008 [Pseudogymnoascus sp. VKM F-4513 (FW-928)]